MWLKPVGGLIGLVPVGGPRGRNMRIVGPVPIWGLGGNLGIPLDPLDRKPPLIPLNDLTDTPDSERTAFFIDSILSFMLCWALLIAKLSRTSIASRALE